jgi:hypothetical protein
MAAPPRPATVITGNTVRYQSLDHIDEELYNNLGTQYERTAFIAAVDDGLARIATGSKQCRVGTCTITNKWKGLAAFVDGTAIQAEWEHRRKYLIKKWRGKPRKYRPDQEAELPLLASPVAHPVAPPPLLPQPDLVPHGLPPPEFEPPDLAPPDLAPTDIPQAPISPETVAGGSLPYVLYDHEVWIHPSRNQRAYVREYMRDQNWKFARVLYQTAPREEHLHPHKNVLLYIRPNADGQIAEVS